MDSVTLQSLYHRAVAAMTSDPQEGLRLGQETYEEALLVDDENLQAESLVCQAWSQLYLSRSGEALASFTAAHGIFVKKGNEEGILKTLDGLGSVYQRFSRFQTALEQFSQALKLARDLGNRDSEFIAINRIGELYRDIGQFEDALSYFLEAHNLINKSNNKEHQATILTNLGQTYIHLGRSEEALEHLSHALVLNKEIDNKLGEAKTLTQIGQIYRKIGEVGIAETYHQECLKICMRINNKWGQLEAYLHLADLARYQAVNDEKIQWFYEKVIALGADVDSKLYSSRGYMGLSEFWQNKKEYQKALECMLQYVTLEKYLRTEALTQKINNINVQFEFEKSQAEAEILRLKAEALERQSVELRQSYMTVSIISEIGKKITAALKIKKLLQGIYDNIKELMDATIFGLALYKPKSNSIHYKILMENGVSLPRFIKEVSEGENFSSWCVIHKKPLLLRDVPKEGGAYLHHEASSAFMSEKTPHSLIYLPLIIEEEIIGLLTVQSYEPGSYDETHLAILEALGGYISIALQNSMNHKKAKKLNKALKEEKVELEKATTQIQHMAHHDNLTGLANRRLLSDYLMRTLSYSQRNHNQFAVLFLDLDGFKPVNDTLGHDAGDTVLVEVSRRLTQALRESDIVARVGGDEFVAVAQEVEGLPGAETVAKRILESLAVPMDLNGQVFHLGASIGIAVYPFHGCDAESLLHSADEAMYAIKRSGKNSFGFCQTAGNSSNPSDQCGDVEAQPEPDSPSADKGPQDQNHADPAAPKKSAPAKKKASPRKRRS